MNGDADAESSPESWLRYAEADLAVMNNALEDGISTREVCFHGQQATEKALKALVALQQGHVPYTHDLLALHLRLQPELRPPVDIGRLDLLTALESQSRYPGDWPEPSDDEAQWSSELANAVVRSVRGAIP